MATELWLIRHGQAAFATDDYDRLTDLGWQQARWLGEHLAQTDITFDRVMHGQLRRQRETAEAIVESIDGAPEEVFGFEEYSAEAIMMAAGWEGHDPSVSRREHFRRMRGALLRWAAGELEGAETWDAFNARVRNAVAEAVKNDGRVLVAASGGSIALTLMQVMDLRADQWIEFNLQTRNASITRLVFSSSRTYVNMFNAIPHLERPDRKHAETYS
ncbi:MAG: histidine phosphatase family protein [Pseudomonadota bacterium]